MPSESRPRAALPSPWDEFLAELDSQLEHTVEMHCAGAFVLIALYGREIPTGDIDYIEAIPPEDVETLQTLAGPDSRMAKKYGLQLQFVPKGGIADVPENYASRLIRLFPGCFSNLHLRALDPHDLVLSKVTRNAPRDERDFAFLAGKGLLDPAVLQDRYQEEMRPYISNEERHELTLKLWLEAYFPR